MPDSNESKDNQPVSIPKRRPIRLLSVISIMSSSLIFACAGCCYLTVFLFGPLRVDGPEQTNQLASRITDWTLPADFSGKSGSRMKNALFRFDIAMFKQKQGRGTLVVAEFYSKVLPAPDRVKGTMDFMRQNTPELKKIDVEERKFLTLTVRDLPAKFELSHGEDRASTTKYHQVIGNFRGKSDDAALILQYEDGVLTDKDIDDFLKSIK